MYWMSESPSLPMTPRCRIFLFVGVGLLFFSVSAPATVPDSTAFTEGAADFSVRFGDETIRHRVMAVTAPPDTSLRIAADAPAGYQIEAPEGTVRSISDRRWRFSAPSSPGLYPVTLTDTTSGASVRLQVFVTQPWNHDGTTLKDYRIGHYEMQARAGQERYEPPTGFIEVTAENKDVRVAPNFRLEQFLCKQTDETPQFALVQTRLLQRLETILAALNDRGHDVPTLHVMSGFRTPYYNRAIGNTTEYSRHLYGDAADVFVDTSGNGRMDDLTGDGRVDQSDAQYLAGVVRGVPTPGDDRFNGGLGVYGPAPHRGPFVHVDLRGYRARW